MCHDRLVEGASTFGALDRILTASLEHGCLLRRCVLHNACTAKAALQLSCNGTIALYKEMKRSPKG